MGEIRPNNSSFWLEPSVRSVLWLHEEIGMQGWSTLQSGIYRLERPNRVFVQRCQSAAIRQKLSSLDLALAPGVARWNDIGYIRYEGGEKILTGRGRRRQRPLSTHFILSRVRFSLEDSELGERAGHSTVVLEVCSRESYCMEWVDKALITSFLILRWWGFRSLSSYRWTWNNRFSPWNRLAWILYTIVLPVVKATENAEWTYPSLTF